MFKRIFCIILASSSLLGAPKPFLERLETAKTGDYVVLEANQTITLLAIRSINSQSLIVEEISAPSSALKKRPESWAAWVRQQAPGHTSWSMTEIDLKDRQVLECYSFSNAAWLTLNTQKGLLATLLHLPLKAVPQDQRKKIGPPPQEGEADRRSAWNPPLVFDGEKVQNALFDVFEAVWPQDGTELAGQNVSLYFDRTRHTALPYWIQVDTSHATASVRAIDSGKNLPSLYRTLPRRTPEFVGAPQKTKEGIRLLLKSPKYYRDFELFAIDVTTREKQIFPIAHSLISEEGDLLAIDIGAEELNQVLQPDRKYTWLIVPSGHTESYTESHKPFSWAPN